MLIAALVLALSCTDSPDDSTASMQWWEDPCGRRDPVERTCPKGVKTVEVGTEPTCADEGTASGAPCSEAGATCIQLRPVACEDDPKTVIASDAVLTCGTEPPGDECPISLRERKVDIAYLDGPARTALASEVLGLRLATYAYRDPAHDGAGRQLGYVLDDAPRAVFSGTDHVNLYAYTSAILAAVQVQQGEIDRLRAELESLEGDCAPTP